MKKCPGCGEIKQLTEFHKRRNRPCGIQARCKECSHGRVEKWHLENKEKRVLYLKNRQENNTLAVRSIRLKSYRKLNNTKARLVNAIKCGMHKHLKRGTKGGRHWEDLVGFTLEQLKSHLESNFTQEMTWGNYGSFWEIDHIIPVSAFNFKTAEDFDFRRCWCLKNLQPLEAKANLSKGAKILEPFQFGLGI
jgi:hypothetical protein